MLKQSRIPKNSEGGFSLVELLVAMVLGLIVIGAVIALVLSMIRANTQTIQATRLTQELRATAALMSADLRRAGGVIDPLTVATANNGNPANPFQAITIPVSPNNTCIQFGYANPVGKEALNYHTISLSGTEVRVATNSVASPACGSGTRLSSSQVTITGLTFAQTGRRIDITLAGRLSGTINSNINRAFTQSVFVRSVPGT